MALPMTHAGKIIFDFGANTGQDIPYYLLKADRVIAVEANQRLCNDLRQTFAPYVDSGQLTIINKALVAPAPGEACPASVTLHIPRQGYKQGLDDGHSTIVNPEQIKDSFFADPDAYESVEVSAIDPASLIRLFGDPHYVKIDLEHYDQHVLANLFAAGIFPDYISSECHVIDVFELMKSSGEYEEFNLIVGHTVGDRYSGTMVTVDAAVWQQEAAAVAQRLGIESDGLNLRYPFPFKIGMSGPFGDDIPTPWMGTVDVFHELIARGLGWIDLHARRRSH